ncbi:Rad51-domain-containing protein [Mucor lusitanicus]|uniref:DNA repair protein RAD51 homolog 3 n=1 Tax=Mucor circinelloides f. lusitanicus TaxID=29924 RepID=A0A8H4F233_MUCCL|nr:Rad51-domain-containing protein [Mucor lusitanicus]
MSLSKVIKLPSLLQKLEESGYETLDEVKRECLSSLTRELELNKEEIKAVGNLGAKDKTKTIKIDESLTMEIESSFTTAVKNFDRLFVYGISPKKITEICGESGTGKTQLCMQMAVTIQLPKDQGGSEGECVYIDTEGSFNALRVQKMAERFGLRDPLKKIHLFRVLNHTEFVAIIMQLMEILTNRTKVKLVIIDSMAYHLRVNALPFRARIDFLNFAGPHLIKIAQNLTVSIVVTNHVTTSGVNDQWTPSLGNEWGNWCANRLFLYRKRNFRYGYLYKSVEEIQNVESVQFCIKWIV